MKILERIEKIVFGLLLIILPWQLKDVLLSYEAGGFFNEWRSVSLYGSDLLLLFLLILFLLGRGLRKEKIISSPLSLIGFLPGFLGLLSLSFSPAPLLTWNFSLHFLLAGILFFYILERKPSLKEIFLPLLVGVIVQAVVALIQFISGHSAGLFFLDESHLDVSSKENAVVDFLGERRLRAYGLSSHPNVLGAWAAFSSFLLTLGAGIFSRRWLWVGLVAGIGLALLTFSKAALLMLILALLFLWASKAEGRWPWLLVLFFGFLLLWPGWQSRFNLSIPKEQRSVEERISGAREAVAMIQASWPLGLGGGAYLTQLARLRPNLAPWSYQPVHNLFLLSLAELGVWALIFWAVILGVFLAFWRQAHFAWLGLAPWLLILMPALFDHFLWSMQEGRILLMFALGLALLLLVRPKPGGI